jgi:Tat protein secretion system quality control protein TatD with DNase activity
MLGEVGLDRVFRIPLDYFASPRHLTTFTIPLAHQVAILEAQIEVAVELGRIISVHSVKSQQATLELLGKMKRKSGIASVWICIAVGSIHRPGGISRYVGGGPDYYKTHPRINSFAEET